jgi:hypothetical protein
MGRFLIGSERSVYDDGAAPHPVSDKAAKSPHGSHTGPTSGYDDMLFPARRQRAPFQNRPSKVNANPIAHNAMTMAAIGIQAGDLRELSVSRLIRRDTWRTGSGFNQSQAGISLGLTIDARALKWLTEGKKKRAATSILLMTA